MNTEEALALTPSSAQFGIVSQFIWISIFSLSHTRNTDGTKLDSAAMKTNTVTETHRQQSKRGATLLGARGGCTRLSQDWASS
jgi:hypothetical protein